MTEPSSKRSWTIAAGVLFALGVVAGLSAIILLFSHVSSWGSDCGTILSPKEPLPTDPNPLLAGCGGDRVVRTVFVVVLGAVAVAFIVAGLLLRRRGHRALAQDNGPALHT